MARKTFFTVLYSGPSMNPLFRTGDTLYVIPYGKRRIQAGDVVIYTDPLYGRDIAHRVVRVKHNAIRTRGDNNRGDDAHALGADQVHGQVVFLRRGRVRKRVQGGMAGRMYACSFVLFKHIVYFTIDLIRPVYRYVNRTGFLRICRLKTRILAFQRPAGTEYQACIGSFVIGRRLPGQSRWMIKTPFALFIDQRDLTSAMPDTTGLPDERSP